jgi:hypothetical protein
METAIARLSGYRFFSGHGGLTASFSLFARNAEAGVATIASIDCCAPKTFGCGDTMPFGPTMSGLAPGVKTVWPAWGASEGAVRKVWMEILPPGVTERG